MFQKYRTMTNRKYRIITNLVIPLGIMIITIVLWKYFGYLTDLFMVGVFMTAEVMEDYFGFGSTCINQLCHVNISHNIHRGDRNNGGQSRQFQHNPGAPTLTNVWPSDDKRIYRNPDRS